MNRDTTNWLHLIATELGEDIDAQDFVRLLRHVLLILNGIARNCDVSVSWQITEISKKSPLEMHIRGVGPDSAPPVTDYFVSGIKALSSKREKPDYFEQPELRHARTVASLLGKSFVSVNFSSPENEAPLTSGLIDNVNAIPKRGAHYEAIGTLEGRLIRLHVETDIGISRLGIRESVSGKFVECKFDPEDAESVGSRMTHRVRVQGTIKYLSVTDDPVSMEVDDWEPIGNDLPTLEDFHAAGFRWEGAESPDEIISDLRSQDG